jgi:hypothetical protein
MDLENRASPMGGRLTVSIGAGVSDAEFRTGAAALVDLADRALYEAKKNGTEPDLPANPCAWARTRWRSEQRSSVGLGRAGIYELKLSHDWARTMKNPILGLCDPLAEHYDLIFEDWDASIERFSQHSCMPSSSLRAY